MITRKLVLAAFVLATPATVVTAAPAPFSAASVSDEKDKDKDKKDNDKKDNDKKDEDKKDEDKKDKDKKDEDKKDKDDEKDNDEKDNDEKDNDEKDDDEKDDDEKDNDEKDKNDKEHDEDENSGGGPTVRNCTAATGMLASDFYVDCLGGTSGNIEGRNSDVSGLTGSFAGHWEFIRKWSFEKAGNTGTVTFSSALRTRFILGVKAGNFYSLYLYDGSKLPGGSIDEYWETIGVAANTKNNGQGISHLNLYVESCQTDCGGVPVPEPASTSLLGAGLLAVGVAARRRRNLSR